MDAKLVLSNSFVMPVVQLLQTLLSFKRYLQGICELKGCAQSNLTASINRVTRSLIKVLRFCC